MIRGGRTARVVVIVDALGVVVVMVAIGVLVIVMVVRSEKDK